MPPGTMSGKIYGTATLNEKGQLVIPVDARVALDLKPGEKLIIMNAPFGHSALVVVKTEVIEQQIKSFADAMNQSHDNTPEANS